MDLWYLPPNEAAERAQADNNLLLPRVDDDTNDGDVTVEENIIIPAGDEVNILDDQPLP